MTDKCGACPLDAILMAAKVKIVDKTTGADLFLSPGSPYKPSDLKVNSSLTGPNYSFNIDSTETNNRVIWLSDYGSVTYTVQLANLSADHIKIVAGLNSKKCCPTNEVKSIMVNDSLICAPCSPQQSVTIRK